MVILPPRPANCDLQIVTVRAEDMAPGGKFGPGGRYQMIGMVALGVAQGTEVLSPEVRSLVRPKACGYGGEVVSLTGAGDSNNYVIVGKSIRTVRQTDIVFSVWGPRSAGTEPQRF